jgi:hypothetical protein
MMILDPKPSIRGNVYFRMNLLVAVSEPNPKESIDENTTVMLHLSWRKCNFQILDGFKLD